MLVLKYMILLIARPLQSDQTEGDEPESTQSVHLFYATRHSGGSSCQYGLSQRFARRRVADCLPNLCRIGLLRATATGGLHLLALHWLQDRPKSRPTDMTDQ